MKTQYEKEGFNEDRDGCAYLMAYLLAAFCAIVGTVTIALIAWRIFA